MSEAKRAAPTSSQKSGPVLAAVDFSEDSHAALAWAGEYARLTKAKLMVLHVAHDPAASPGFYRQMGDEWLRPMVEVAEEMMAEFLEAMRKAHPDLGPLQTATTRLVSGLPAGRIVEVAEEVAAPLVVVGSRGRTGLPHILLGSVAERVVQTAVVPVVVVKASPESCKSR
jgi:nucleotide-binding universal stress UspA family protein